jgi:hypothetical protein
LPVHDRNGGFRRIKGDQNVDLVVDQKLPLRGTCFREAAPLAPEERSQLIVPGPQWRGRRGEDRDVGLALEHGGVRRELDQGLLQEG